MPDLPPLGRLLRHLRLQAALSQEELAARSGISARAISDLERGQRPTARFETLRMLADALALPAEDRALLLRAAQAPLIEITLRPPLATPLACRGLPVPPSPLVGRVREVAEVAREVTADGARLITLTGPGGVGKTRLALTVAHDAAVRFPGGVGWVDLSPLLTPGALLPAIADGLGVVETPRQPRIEGLRRRLADRPFLLVLDNFEQLIEAASDVADLLAAAPSLTVLVTSRAPLRIVAEVVYPVTPLSLPAPDAALMELEETGAVRLFVARAQAVVPGFSLTAENIEAVAAICRRLDGLPLAIELAAAWTPVLTPPALLERLEPRLPLLTRSPRDAPHRQQTMAATIGWSYHLLSPEEQRSFRQLAVFVGGFTLDTIEWLAAARGADGTEAVNALATLVDLNLVTRISDTADGPRFSMFETIREYGVVQLVARHELREAQELLAGYCRTLARHGDEIPNCIVPEPWVVMVDRERANIRAAYHHLAAADPVGAFEFATAFGHYLYNRGPIDEGWAWFARTLDAPASRPTVRLQGLYWASHFSSHQGMTDTAERLATEALAIAQDLGDLAWCAAIVHCQALIREKCGHAARAEALFNEELRLWEQAGVRGLSGFAYMMLGEFAFERGDLVRAREMEDKAEEILTDMGGIGWLARTRWYRGQFAHREGDLAEAARHYTDSLRIACEHKTSMIEHRGLIGLASVAAAVAKHETAALLLGAADRSLERTGQHLRGSLTELHAHLVDATRSALGPTAFDAARERGASCDQAGWFRCADAVRHAANAWAHGGGTAAPSGTAAPATPALDP